MSSFGARIKSLRNEKGETRNQVGKALGKSMESVKKYETGERQPDIDSLANLAKHFNVSADYILGISDYDSEPEINRPEYKEFEKYANDKTFKDYLKISIEAFENKLDISELKRIVTELINKNK